MATAKDGYLVALDLGSHTTRCAIAHVAGDGEVELEGYAERPSHGVRKGLVVDAPGAATVARETIQNAAGQAGVRVGTIVAAVATPYARGLNSRGCIGIEHEDKIVRGTDATRALAAANRITLPSDRAVSEALSQGFAVDDVRGIHNPVGIAGGRLEAELHVVTDLQSAHDNMAQVARPSRRGVRACSVESVVFGPAAAATAALTTEEKQLGAALIDIGAGTTSLVLYSGGYPRFSRVLPVGGQHITNDLAIGVNTSVAAAERLKRRPGVLTARRRRQAGETTRVDVPLADGSGARPYPLWRLGFIARARVEEIFELAIRELDRSGVPEAGCARVVLTGGYCKMDGALETARRCLRRPVRIGVVSLPGRVEGFEPDPTHATVLGTLLRGVALRGEQADRRFEEGGLRGLFQKVAGWL